MKKPYVVFNPDNEKWEVRNGIETIAKLGEKVDAEQVLISIKNKSNV